jgi:tetratricopeptide (TPR) repeat protein
MNKIAALLIRLIIPLVALYLAFTYLGTVGGIVLTVLYLVIMNLPMIFNNLATRAYHSGDHEKALKRLETALKLGPKNYSIRGAYAWLLLKLGHTEEADVQIDQALSEAAREDIKSPLCVTKALVHWKKGEIDQAITLMEKVIENYKNSNVYGTLGVLYLEKGDLDRALSFNLEAYDFNNTNAVILDNLGCTRLLRGEYEEAREIYEQLMKLRPSFPEAFYNYARVLAHFGELDQALYMCRTALTLSFWNTSTITKEQVENTLKELEEAVEKKTSESDVKEEHEATEEAESADI